MVSLLVIGFILSSGANAQTAAKTIYAELGGPGLASLNYDMRFQKKEDGLGFRVGFGGFSIDGESLVLVPAGLNYIISKDGKNYFEVGAGATFVNANSNNGFNDDGPFNTTFGHLNIGYRLQPRNGGFLFRAAINPIFGNGVFFPYYGGVSFGYKF